MIFLTEADFNTRINQAILSQITGDDSTQLDNAEAMAIGVVKDMLSGNYDIVTEITNTGSDRHAPLVSWLLSLACYTLYSAIPDNEVPDRIVKDYDDAMATLHNIARGKQPTTLTSVTVDGVSKRVFRMGSNSARNHNLL